MQKTYTYIFVLNFREELLRDEAAVYNQNPLLFSDSLHWSPFMHSIFDIKMLKFERKENSSEQENKRISGSRKTHLCQNEK